MRGLSLVIYVTVHVLSIVHNADTTDNPCNVTLPQSTDRFTKFCPMIDRCPRRAPFKVVTARACFCDDLCTVYRDCCPDYRNTGPEVRTPLDRETYSCRKLDGVWTNNLPVYVVDSCPENWPAGNVKNNCENPEKNDMLVNWPVTDSRTHILYRNVFCLMCNRNNARTVIYFNANIICKVSDNTTDNATTLIGKYMTRGSEQPCIISYNKYTAGNSFRYCKQAVRTCPAAWSNDCVREKCETNDATTQYRYTPTGTTTFKNSYCALCHDSSITCEDKGTKRNFNPVTYDKLIGSNHPLTIHLDQNLKNITIKRRRGSEYLVTKENMKSCRRDQVFDVVVGNCRHLNLDLQTSGFLLDGQKNCFRLSPSDYVKRNDGTVYVNATGKVYKKEILKFKGQFLWWCSNQRGHDGLYNASSAQHHVYFHSIYHLFGILFLILFYKI